MTIQTERPYFWPPGWPITSGAGGISNADTLNAITNGGWSRIIRASKAGVLDRFGSYFPTITIGGNLTFSFETLDAGGLPSGTNFGGSVPVVVAAVTGTPDYLEAVFATGATVAEGDLVACVIRCAAAMNLAIGKFATSMIGSSHDFPWYAKNVLGSGWAKDTTMLSAMTFAVGYGAADYINDLGSYPIDGANGFTNSTIGTAAVNRAWGMRFQSPVPRRFNGIRIARSSAAWRDGFVKLLADDNTVLATGTFLAINLGNSGGPAVIRFDAGADYTIAINTWYRAIFEAGSATTMTMIDFTAPNNDMLDLWPGGKNCYLTTRDSAGVWTNFTSRVPLIGLRANGSDDGAAGGGGGSGVSLARTKRGM